jgi:hypothetical protein
MRHGQHLARKLQERLKLRGSAYYISSRDKGRWRLEEALKKFGQTIQIEQEKKWQEEVVSRNC